MNGIRIPFNRPTVAGDERRYLDEVLSSGHWSGAGPFTVRTERMLERTLGVHKALLTTSCTHALEMAAMLLELSEGDEVIVPSFTFVSTANAFVLRGARPVFADIRPDTLNIDEDRIEALIGPRTKAIVVVHYGGIACEMDRIMEIAAGHGLAVIEDNAHGLGGAYRGRALGTFGRAAALSFHETKNFTCGEGGALLLNDPDWVRRAEILREKGTNRSQFFRGEIEKYHWVDVGSSYLPADLLAALLLAQLESAETIQASRKRTWRRYFEALTGWAIENGVQLPVVPEPCRPAYHLFHLLMPDAGSRDDLLAHLRSRGILAVFHYQPLHASVMGQRFGGKPGDCPIAERVAERLLRLPLFTSMTADEQHEVIEAVTSFMPGRQRPS